MFSVERGNKHEGSSGSNYKPLHCLPRHRARTWVLPMVEGTDVSASPDQSAVLPRKGEDSEVGKKFKETFGLKKLAAPPKISTFV